MPVLEFSQGTVSLNPEQFRAVTRPAAIHQRILASAGSGKTTTLTSRIAWLLELCGVRDTEIVLMTFSRNAATQMLARLEDLVGKTDLLAGTFHRIAKQLLLRYSPKLLQKLYFVDELITMGIRWLETPEGYLWASSIRYVVVDEFQDINDHQWEFLQGILQHGGKLIVVGDDCQNIYTWRGSNIKYILELETFIPGVVDDQLRCNYRSSEAIIRAANAVMAKIPTLPWKGTMLAQRKGGPRPTVRFFHRLSDETVWIVKEIQGLVEQGKRICVLSRKNSDLYRLEEEFVRVGQRCRLRDIGIDEESGIGSGAPVDLVTLHASKGLEWDIVFLLNCNDDVFPSSKKPDQIIAERRLFYVGVTRARDELHISYTRDERNLCRFVREIPNPFLVYYGLAKYVLSDFELDGGRSRIGELLKCLDGADLYTLREQGHLQWTEREWMETIPLFPSGSVWRLPAWAKGDAAADFHRFLRVFAHRLICQQKRIPFRDPEAERLIFTLRVFAEDLEFWQTWKQEIRAIMDEWYATPAARKYPPPIEYSDLEKWSRARGILWTPKDLVAAVEITGKLRGQMRPMRFEQYTMDEFRIGPSRFVVPIQWRAEVLRSWRRIVDLSVPWEECLGDIWRIGALPLVSSGRNVALYRAKQMKDRIEDLDLREYFRTLEGAIAAWISREGDLDTNVVVQTEEGCSESIDLLSETGAWKLSGTEKESTHELLSLAIAAALCEGDISCIGILVPLEGKIVRLKLPEDWKDSAQQILAAALAKAI
jgi:hypothetical protein